MADYASQTVAQLKEILKSKGLSLDGKKADLVQRLQEAEEATEVPAAASASNGAESETTGVEVPAAISAPEPSAAEVVAAAPASTEGDAASAAADAADSEGAAKVEEKPKPLTADERKQLAVELLEKKVQRAIKFGDEQAAEAAKKDLARVEKFGVELGTALAREIGLVDKSLGNGFKKFNKHRKNFKPKNKNFKKKNNQKQ
ncbi:protein Tho1p [[Candida] railenensis]|uniref:Protein Tho1p n=1 Tax=[Candida] railenensis TaxID=45579 RepID=A0A9P0QKZ3_9ASCO|nr:protein Tho1p [[Candida] railenensis]